MKYAKPVLTFEQQADQLLARGLQANRETFIARLEAVNYYRSSGFLYPRLDEGDQADCKNLRRARLVKSAPIQRRLTKKADKASKMPPPLRKLTHDEFDLLVRHGREICSTVLRCQHKAEEGS